MADAFVFIVTVGFLIQPVKDLIFPPPPADLVTNIRIGAGSNDFNDGNIPGVHLFDLTGKTIGFTKSNGDNIGKGQEKDISVTHLELADPAAAQAEYISVVQGGNDALCISYLTASLSNGVQYSWNGDIGFQCGALWMFGNTTFSSDPSGGIYQPRCVWIDGDDSNGLHTKAMGIHLPSFLANQGRVDEYNSNNDVMCKADPRFKLYDELDVEDPIPHFVSPPFDLGTLIDFDPAKTLDPANWATTPVDRTPLQGIGRRDRGSGKGWSSSCANSTKSASKDHDGQQHSTTCANSHKEHGSGNGTATGWNGTRKAPKQSAKHVGQLIKSNMQHHKASELCGSSTSWGPDFISLAEGIYCDMDSKKSWPLCKDATQVACFDDAANKMRLGSGNSRRDATGVPLPRKVYTSVVEW